MPSSGRMALGLLFLTGCGARHFSLVFIRPRTARGGSPNRPKPSALHKQGAVAHLRLLNSGWREILPDDQVHDLATQLLDAHSLRAADSLQLAASSPGVSSVPERVSSAGTSDWPKPQNQLDSRFSNPRVVPLTKYRVLSLAVPEVIEDRSENWHLCFSKIPYF